MTPAAQSRTSAIKPEESTVLARSNYEFYDKLRGIRAARDGAVLDSAVIAREFSESGLPEEYAVVHDWLAALDRVAPGKGWVRKLNAAVLDGANTFAELHGREISGDLLQQAIHNAFAWTPDAANLLSQVDAAAVPRVLDSATLNSSHQKNDELRAEAIIVSTLQTISTAVPFASFLPIAVGSQTAHLAILHTAAATTHGAYKQGDSLDGLNNGDDFLFASRYHQCAIDDQGRVTGKLTTTQKDSETCDPEGSPVKLLVGRSRVMVNGVECGKETSYNVSGWSQVSGAVDLDGVSYSISGKINTDTGDVDLVTSPPLPESNVVGVEGFIDYERAPENIPGVIAGVDKYTLNAYASRAFVRASVDAATQAANELGLSLAGESLRSLQIQFGNERHFKLLRMARRVANRYMASHDFDWVGRGAQLSRVQIFPEIATTLAVANHDMINRTNAFGIGFIYVNQYLAGLLLQMPPEIFQWSGVAARPGIYRLGTLFSQYEVYYTPRVVKEGVVEGRRYAEMLCIGKSPDTARAPFIIGDVTPAFLEEVGKNMDFRDGYRFRHAGYTTTSPHMPSAVGASLITIKNLE